MAHDYQPFELDSDWRLISDGATESISFQVKRGTAEVRVTAANEKPNAGANGWDYSASGRDGELNKPLSELGAAVSLGNSGYVWARGAMSFILVDHA